MAAGSAIEWTDATWNPVRGCSRVSPGCGGPGRAGGCYAEGIAARFSDPGQPYHGFAERGRSGSKWTGHVALIDKMLTLPLRWKRPRRIFVNSMSDLFHEALPDEARDRVFAVMAILPQHTFQVLTKRAARMRKYLNDPRRYDFIHAAIFDNVDLTIHDPNGCIRCLDWLDQRRCLPNVWLGVSVEDQERAEERIPLLLETPAAVRFISAEPLLGPVDLTNIRDPNHFPGCLRQDVVAARAYHEDDDNQWTPLARLDWVIAGGESGPRARPMHPDWARSLRDQCAAAGVPFFFKQWGEWAPQYYGSQEDEGIHRLVNVSCGREIGPRTKEIVIGERDQGQEVLNLRRIGKKAAGARLDGREHREFPRPAEPVPA